MKKTTIIIIPFIVFVLTTLLVFFGIEHHWFGEVRPGLMKFCEHARDGFILQPANSFSNLGFSIAGLLLAFQAAQGQFSSRNSMNDNALYTILFSIGLIVTGAGSFAMHATNAHWGGFMDLLGMFLIAAFMFAYALTRLLHWSKGYFFVIYSMGVVLSSVVYLSPTLNFKGFMSGAEVCFIFMSVTAIFIELYLGLIRKINIKKAYGYFALFCLILAFTIWNFSLWPDSILCKPHSLLQGHAAWHILDAIGAYFVFRFYASEIN